MGVKDSEAVTVWNFLSDENRAIHFDGLPLIVELLGIDDIEGLLQRLYLIKNHQRPTTTDP